MVAGNLDLILDTVVQSISRKQYTDGLLTHFFPRKGSKSERGFMVIGRAVNGWLNGFDAKECLNPERRLQLVDTARRAYVEDECEMAWVCINWGNTSAYNTARSAFWRVTRNVFTNLAPEVADKADWSSYLIWSNAL